MLGLFKTAKETTAGPRGHRAYAIGDIHGRLDLLEQLLAAVEDDNLNRPRARTSLIFLGDLIDRGPDSAQVVERLRTYRPAGIRTVFLLGNHEEVFLRILDGDPEQLRDWLRFGGAECASSYGLDPEELKRLPAERGLAVLARAVPREHVEFLKGFADTVAFGSYIFVHAGIRPGVALSEQSGRDLRWIREPFLSDDRNHGATIVHGHTISEDVEERGNRIGIDTGAYRTGVLTAMGFEGQRRWFLQSGGAMHRSELKQPGSMRSPTPDLEWAR